MSYKKPYEGLKVIDFSQGVAGPYCGMLLAQQGAEVIKVEPMDGDWARNLGQEYGEHSAFSVAANLGKKSIVIDLKNQKSLKIIDKIIKDVDVFIEGFRPGVIDKLGLGYERLKKDNPKLIYLSISGFGQRGPMSKKPAMDPVIQAFTGFMSENKGPDNIPHRTPVIIFDMATALYAMQIISATIFARISEKFGKKIEISLMESAAAFQSIRLMSGYMEGPYKHASSPSGTFKTKDGWIQLIVVKNHEFTKFCDAVGWNKFKDDPRFSSNTKRREHENFLTEEVQKLFANKPTDYWKNLLDPGALLMSVYINSIRQVCTPVNHKLDVFWCTISLLQANQTRLRLHTPPHESSSHWHNDILYRHIYLRHQSKPCVESLR